MLDMICTILSACIKWIILPGPMYLQLSMFLNHVVVTLKEDLHIFHLIP